MDKKKERRRRLYAELLGAVIGKLLVYMLADAESMRLLKSRFDELCGRIYYARHGGP